MFKTQSNEINSLELNFVQQTSVAAVSNVFFFYKLKAVANLAMQIYSWYT